MDKQKIISKLCDKVYEAMELLKEGKLSEASNQLFSITKEIDSLITIINL